MKRLSFFGNLKLTMFSKPVEDRMIYQLIKKHQFETFVEVGLGDHDRFEKMIQVAYSYSNSDALRYTGVDLFDARLDSQRPLKLIEMHKRMKGLPAKTQLVPGDLASAIQRIANSHLRTDLVVLSHGFDDAQFDAAISFIPRMMHSSSMLLVQRKAGQAFEVLNRIDVERMVASLQKSMAAKRKEAA